MGKTILMLGTFDTKAKEFLFLYEELGKRNVSIITMNTGVLGTTDLFTVSIEASEVALAAGVLLEDLRKQNDRGIAMAVMGDGAKIVVERLFAKGEIHGIIGMGGGGGTSVATTAMRSLPIGFPKVCITTLASGDTSAYIGTKDIVLFPSIVDICGINRFSRQIISRAAGAICGMVDLEPPISESERPIIFISMFGNTTKCVEQCSRLLEEQGYDSMVFHATGSGGRAMEELIEEKYPVAVLDITTTEWADEICGGILSAGSTRLEAPGKVGIPHLIAPGCVDMVNFGGIDTVPREFIDKKRLLYQWNPMVTLMRTNREENIKMGEIFAQKANNSLGLVKFLFPKRGVSILDGDGQLFQDWQVNQTLFDIVENNIKEDIEVVEIECNINDLEFSEKAVEMLLSMLNLK